MVLSLKNIRKSNGVSNCTIIEVDNTKYILLNRADRIEMYNYELGYIRNIDLGIYISLMNTVSIANKEYLIVITTQNTYSIFESSLVFNIEDLKRTTWSHLARGDSNDIYSNSSLISSMVFKDLLLIFTSDGDVLIYTIKKDRLIFDDFPNDFKYLDILDCSSDGMYLVFLVKDIEKNISILKYFSEDGKLHLKNKISREDSIQKKSAHDGVLLEGIKNLDILRNGYLSIGRDILVYEDGDTITTEFANTFVKSKCHFGNKMLYSMEDGELIQVEILNKKINRSKSSQNLHSTVDTTIESSKTPKKIHVTILKKFTEGSNFLNAINKNTILMGNGSSIKMIQIENSIIVKAERIKCSDSVQGVSYSRGNYYLWDNRRVFKMGYSLESSFEDIYKMENTVYRFLVLGSILIVGYKDRGAIIRNKSECLLVTDKILNIAKESSSVIQGVRSQSEQISVYFNTKDEIYFFTDVEGIMRMKCKDILLSSFYSGRALVYTIDRRLKIIDLQRQMVIKELRIEYEVSTILYKDFVYISTYDNHFIVMNDDLKTLKNIQEETFIHSITISDRLFFSNTYNVVKECLVIENDATFMDIYSSHYPISSLSSLDDSLLIISEDTVIFNLTNLTKYRISISGISGACFDKLYHFSKGRKIITCNLANEPAYTFYIHKSINTARKGVNNIVTYLPEKEIALCSGKNKYTTTICRNNTTLVKINNFKSINGVLSGDRFSIAGYTTNESLVVDLNDKCRGGILNLESDDRINLLIKEKDEVVNISKSENNLLLFNSNSIFLYRKNLTKPIKFNIDCTIHKVYFHREHILILDYFRSFYLLKYSPRNDSFSIESSPNLPYKFNNGLLTDKLILVSTLRDLYVFDRQTMKVIGTYHLGNDIISIQPNSLEIDSSESIYIFTSNTSTFLLTLI